MDKTPSDPFASLRNLMLAFQKASQPIIEINNRMNEVMKPLIQLSATIQKQMEPIGTNIITKNILTL